MLGENAGTPAYAQKENCNEASYLIDDFADELCLSVEGGYIKS